MIKLATEVQLSRCNHSNARKLFNDLMTCLFEPDEMATKSIYGQECNIHRSSSQAATGALDQRKVIMLDLYLHVELP